MPKIATDKQIEKLQKVRKRFGKIIKSLQENEASSSSSSSQLEEVKKLELALSKTVQSLAVHVALERQEFNIDLMLIQQEIRKDIMDRDAHEAKQVDRLRIASERGEKLSTVMLRNREGVQQIEREMGRACPWFRTKICRSVQAFEQA